MNKKIAIIGGGNLGKSIAAGLLRANVVRPEDLIITRRKIQFLLSFSEQGVNVTSDNHKAVNESDIVIFSVKPHKINDILLSVKSDILKKKPIVISTVTGVKLTELAGILGNTISLYRTMPNIAISVGESMTCISTNSRDEVQNNTIAGLFNVMGHSAFIDDDLMGAATVLAASGIAFAMRYIRAAMQAGIEIGFSSELSKQIVTQTVRGASVLLQENNIHPESEIDKVTTPRGITITGLSKMELHGFSSSLVQGVLASFEKIKEIK